MLVWQTGPLPAIAGFYFVDCRKYGTQEHIIVIHTYGTDGFPFDSGKQCAILTDEDMNYGGCPILLAEGELKIARWAGPIDMPEA